MTFSLRKLTLAMTLCGVVGSPLLAAENPQPLRVLASLPITYGLGEVLLKGTDVSLERAAPANLPGSRQTAYFTGRGAPALGKLAGDADAVIGVRSLWADDPLYPIAPVSYTHLSIWFIAVISITGTWFLIQAILADNQVSISSEPIIPAMSRESVPMSNDASPPPRISLDRAVQIAEQHIPGLDVSFISLPGNAYSHLSVGGRGWYPLMFQTATLNPYNGDMAATRMLTDRSSLEFVTESMRPLHTGDFGGLWIKLIWFFFGLLLSMMVLSGLLIWTKRTALATANALKRENKKARSPRVSREPAEVSL